eukprot:Em0001g2131a
MIGGMTYAVRGEDEAPFAEGNYRATGLQDTSRAEVAPMTRRQEIESVQKEEKMAMSLSGFGAELESNVIRVLPSGIA